jgi:hypothetical protein
MDKKIKRSFGQYLKDNWIVFIPFFISLFFSYVSFHSDDAFISNAYWVGVGFIGLAVFCVVGSIIDWKRNG